MVMTTGRADAFDPAIHSRLHLAIEYPEITPDQRMTILKGFLSRLPPIEIGSEEERDRLLQDLVELKISRKQKLNGRQLRNIVFGARALARSKGNRLTLAHIQSVLDTTREFAESIADLAATRMR